MDTRSSKPLLARGLIAASIGWTLAMSVPAAGSSFERIDAAAAQGRLSFSEAGRLRLDALFDRAHLAAEWRSDDDPPAKCATVVLMELAASRARLDPATRHRLDAILAAPEGPGTSTYTTAHFRVEYATSGPDAPVATDVAPANGIPDFVEWTGAACEQAWANEVAELGYLAPAVANGQSARYPVTYQAQDAYGYTTVISGQQTRMVLHPSYAGFPFNDDPEGDVIGALRVTVAHELKHAIQRMYSPWTEEGWLELDATWIEDVVFDQVNDYVNFIRGAGSPFTAPSIPLFQGNAASYEDCNWETYLAATRGNDFLRGFWERRRDFPGESVLLSWQQHFFSSGTDLAQLWGDYVAWNFASGDHAVLGYGYEEAATYPTTPATFVHETLPVGPISWPVNGTAASAHLFSNPDATLGGAPEFTFNGAPGNLWQVTLLIHLRGGGLIATPIALTSGTATVQPPGIDWTEIDWAAWVVGNPTPANPAISYSFSARAVAPILIAHARLLDRAESPQAPAARAVIAPGTSTLDPSSVALTYQVNADAPITVPMSATGSPQEYGANLPNTVAGTIVAYRIEARSIGGALASSPSVAGAFHTFEVVSVFEPFETPGAWTVGDAGDGAISGTWERAIPLGTLAAPYVDATSPPGSACFLTQNGSVGGLSGEADVDGGKTTLRSPVFGFPQVPWTRAEARYRRWYSNHVGARPDDVWRVDASNDGGAHWVNVETASLGENHWRLVTIDLLALFGSPDRVQFRFVAEDGGAGSLVEAALDDFEMVAVPLDPVGVPGERPGARVALGSAVPNPSRAGFHLRLTLPEAARVSADVRDLQGRVVRHLLVQESRPKGSSWVEWDGRAASGRPTAPGIYWVEVRSDAVRLRRRMVRLGW